MNWVRAGLAALVMSIMFSACGGFGADAGEARQRRDQQFLHAWCETLLGVGSTGTFSPPADAGPERRQEFGSLVEKVYQRYRPEKSVEGVEPWHDRVTAALDAWIAALKSGAEDATLKPLDHEVSAAAEALFPDSELPRMQAAAHQVRECIGTPADGVTFGGVVLGDPGAGSGT